MSDGAADDPGGDDDDGSTTGRATGEVADTRPGLKSGSAAGTQRIDKWLWFCRVVKSRTMAAGLVADGKVRLNRERIAKPSQQVKPGDVITVTAHRRVRVLKVLSGGVRRGPPAEAQRLFEDLSPPEPPRADLLPGGGAGAAGGGREAGSGRPTKKDRRALDRLMGDDES